MNRTARKIIMIVAASVFVFSSAMVLEDYLQMKAAAEFSESISETGQSNVSDVVELVRYRAK